jgi:uncharacterized membrane protein YidH (DUF202 family)
VPDEGRAGEMLGFGSPLFANIVVPVRTEPRSFFANERTLLLWLELASALAVVGSALTAAGQSFPTQTAGLCLSIPAAAFVMYAIRMYILRQLSLVHKRPMHFEDKWGTFVICLLVTGLVIANAAQRIYINYQGAVNSSDFTDWPIVNVTR